MSVLSPNNLLINIVFVIETNISGRKKIEVP